MRNLERDHRPADPLRQLQRRRQIGSLEQDRELFTAVPGHDDSVLRLARDRGRHAPQHVIPREVTVMIVVRLEVVDVAQDQRGVGTPVREPLARAIEAAAIRDRGQTVDLDESG